MTTLRPSTSDGMEITTDRFREAFARHIDASKPDPLARSQMEKLRLDWTHADDGTDVPPTAGGPGMSLERRRDNPLQRLCGSLRFASDYMAITIHAESKYQWLKDEGDEKREGNNDAVDSSDAPKNFEEEREGNDDADNVSDTSKQFDNEFSMELTVKAEYLRFTPPKEGRLDVKELETRKNLHDGMIKRLKSDSLIRRLMNADPRCDGGNYGHTNVPLCEALMQENLKSNAPADGGKPASELEERVNVNEESLEGIRKAIFSHCESNLDVLGILLDMPYFLRRSSDVGNELPRAAALAERAYLRLLEDALFDACEKEGEDEMLDELNISADREEGGGKRRR